MHGLTCHAALPRRESVSGRRGRSVALHWLAYLRALAGTSVRLASVLRGSPCTLGCSGLRMLP